MVLHRFNGFALQAPTQSSRMVLHRFAFSCSKSLIWSSHWHSDTGGCYARQLTRHCEISAARWRHGNFFIIFLHITSFIDKALLKKPMFLQGGSFCTSILSSKTPGNKISWCSQGGVEILDDEYFGYFLWPRKVRRCSVKNFCCW